MRDLERDVTRLDYLLYVDMGLEAFSVSTRMADFFQYYANRFVSNIKHAFRDFSHPELVNYYSRFKRQVDLTLSDPLIRFNDLVVPIPRGMLASYKDTLDGLSNILERIHAPELFGDFDTVAAELKGSSPSLPKSSYTKKMFEQDKSTIGGLYSKVGLTHSTSKKVLVSLTEVRVVKQTLIDLTTQYYAQTIAFSKRVDEFDKTFTGETLSVSDRAKAAEALAQLAYRLSIFAVVLDHIQGMEHAFVKVLETLRQVSHRS